MFFWTILKAVKVRRQAGLTSLAKADNCFRMDDALELPKLCAKDSPASDLLSSNCRVKTKSRSNHGAIRPSARRARVTPPADLAVGVVARVAAVDGLGGASAVVRVQVRVQVAGPALAGVRGQRDAAVQVFVGPQGHVGHAGAAASAHGKRHVDYSPGQGKRGCVFILKHRKESHDS